MQFPLLDRSLENSDIDTGQNLLWVIFQAVISIFTAPPCYRTRKSGFLPLHGSFSRGWAGGALVFDCSDNFSKLKKKCRNETKEDRPKLNRQVKCIIRVR